MARSGQREEQWTEVSKMVREKRDRGGGWERQAGEVVGDGQIHGGKKLEDLLGVGLRPRDAITWGRDQRGEGLAKCPERV